MEQSCIYNFNNDREFFETDQSQSLPDPSSLGSHADWSRSSHCIYCPEWEANPDFSFFITSGYFIVLTVYVETVFLCLSRSLFRGKNALFMCPSFSVPPTQSSKSAFWSRTWMSFRVLKTASVTHLQLTSLKQSDVMRSGTPTSILFVINTFCNQQKNVKPRRCQKWKQGLTICWECLIGASCRQKIDADTTGGGDADNCTPLAHSAIRDCVALSLVDHKVLCMWSLEWRRIVLNSCIHEQKLVWMEKPYQYIRKVEFWMLENEIDIDFIKFVEGTPSIRLGITSKPVHLKIVHDVVFGMWDQIQKSKFTILNIFFTIKFYLYDHRWKSKLQENWKDHIEMKLFVFKLVALVSFESKEVKVKSSSTIFGSLVDACSQDATFRASRRFLKWLTQRRRFHFVFLDSELVSESWMVHENWQPLLSSSKFTCISKLS